MAQKVKKPELVAPGGNFEKLKLAYDNGADAVYVGGPVFGLRKYSDNFSLTELKHAIHYANSINKKMYIVLNGFARNTDLEKLKHHLDELEVLQPHAFIISDLGVLSLTKEHTTVPIHLSTQASVTNQHTVNFWKEYGVKRLVLARECSLDDCSMIRRETGVEIETFIHGAMCASYSGKCVISNYTSGRDSNRGGCIQTCRHKFDVIKDDKTLFSSHIMNAKDLNGADLVPEFLKSGIDALKIEGRMKSNFYVANTLRVYRKLIDDYDVSIGMKEELNGPSNRSFERGGLSERPSGDSISYDFNGYLKTNMYVGLVKKVIKDQGIWIQVKTEIKKGESLTFLNKNKCSSLTLDSFFSISGMPLEKTKPDSFIQIPFSSDVSVNDVVVSSLLN